MGRQGFEPRTEWLRATCSTAELTPRYGRDLYFWVGRAEFKDRYPADNDDSATRVFGRRATVIRY